MAESKEIQAAENKAVNPYGHMGELYKVAQTFAQSGIVPNAYKGKPADCFVALQMGHELNLQPMASLRNIHVIQGRPSLSAQVMLGLIKAQPDYAGSKWTASARDHCRIEISRYLKDGKKETEIGEFTIQEAQAAGLTGKDNWKSYQKQMLEARAISFAARKLYPDLFSGIYTKEEVQDFDSTPSEPRNVSPQHTAPSGGFREQKQPQGSTSPEESTPDPEPEPEPKNEVNPVQPGEVLEAIAEENKNTPEILLIFDWALTRNLDLQEKLAAEVNGYYSHDDTPQGRREKFKDILRLYLYHPKIKNFILEGGRPLIEYLEADIIGNPEIDPRAIWQAIRDSFALVNSEEG